MTINEFRRTHPRALLGGNVDVARAIILWCRHERATAYESESLARQEAKADCGPLCAQHGRSHDVVGIAPAPVVPKFRMKTYRD